MLLLVICKLNSYACTLNIAVASNFSQPAKQIVKKFEDKTGCNVITSVGSTGMLFNQIVNGAPYEVFLAADEIAPKRLLVSKNGVESSLFNYATGKLVLWSAKDSIIDAKGSILSSNKFNYLAIANPKLAPYGLAANEVLNKLGVFTKMQVKIIQGNNINDVYQFVASGNADIGFVALSQVYYQGKIARGSAWVVPVNLYSPIKQDAIITKVGANNKLAYKFMQFLMSVEVKQILVSYGY